MQPDGFYVHGQDRKTEQNMRKGVWLTLFLILVMTPTWLSDSLAAPPTKQVLEKIKREGRLQEFIDMWEAAAQNGMYDPNPARLPSLAKTTAGSVDTLKPLVICVEFTDNPNTYATTDFATLLFTKDYVFPTGSFRDYYLENSYGKHDPQGVVYSSWVTAPLLYSEYTQGVSGMDPFTIPNSRTLALDVVNLVDPYIDFSDFDGNNDGWLDGLMIIHAGPGAEETGDGWDIWSLRWSIGETMRDGVLIESFTMQPEEHAGGSLIDIGVFCHEWGHDLGILWEEYDRYYSSNGLGDWTVMATGCYNGPSGHSGQKPAHHSAYCKYYLGWTDIVRVTSNLTNVEILQAETTPVAYRLWTSGALSNYFFLVENRQKTRFDSYLPGDGLLIYHVDSLFGSNDAEWCPGDPGGSHFKVALEQADGMFGIEGCGGSANYGDLGDPFPGYYEKSAFDDTTTPSSRDYYDNSTQVAVWNISPSDSVMFANLDVTWSRSIVSLEGFSFDDNTSGDGDGRPEPEETVDLYFSLSDQWKSLYGAWVIASADTAGITFLIDSVFIGDILSGATVNNSGKPLRFSVASGFPSKTVEFNLHICGDGGSFCTDRPFSASVGPPEILLVDDDNWVSGDSNYAPIYQSALNKLGAVYETYDMAAKTTTLDLSPYPIVIWFTGNSRPGILPEEDVQAMMDYLDGNGNLFLTSQDAAQKLFTSGLPIDIDFYSNYLHLGDYLGNTKCILSIGVPEDPLGDGLHLRMGGVSGVINQVSEDILLPDMNASAALKYSGYEWVPKDSIAAIKYEGSFKTVLFGFGLESLDSSGLSHDEFTYSSPSVVMEKVLNWFRGYSWVFDEEEETAGHPKAFELHQNYPNPFNPLTTIKYTVNGSQSSVRGPLRITLKIFNVRGQLVRTLVDEEKTRGVHSAIWDGKDEQGSEVSSGVYFYQLNLGDESEVKKMVLLK
jgi:M6 family metalloprotease-like protein